MGADHAFLEGCRRCPVCCCFADLEASDCDVIAPCLGGEEAHSSDVDLGHLGVGIETAEVCVDYGKVAVLLSVPLVLGFFGNP